MTTWDFAIITKMAEGKTIVTPYWEAYSNENGVLESVFDKHIVEQEKIDSAINYALSLDTTEFTVEIRYPA